MSESSESNGAELIEFSALAALFRNHLSQNSSALKAQESPSRIKLQKILIKLIGDFLSKYDLSLTPEEVRLSYLDLPIWNVENVLAKLRSLVEIKAKKNVRQFGAELSYSERQSIQSLLNNAGIYKFRESIESDLYIGVHTAISANFKMIGVALVQEFASIDLEKSCDPLFKVLRQIATLPLSYLMVLDGLFWDSKLYTIPQEITAKLINGNIEYFLQRKPFEARLANVFVSQQRLGCPALKSRTNTGEVVMDLISKLCLQTTQKYYLEYK